LVWAIVFTKRELSHDSGSKLGKGKERGNRKRTIEEKKIWYKDKGNCLDRKKPNPVPQTSNG